MLRGNDLAGRGYQGHLSAEVPRSIARMWRVMGLYLEEQVEIPGEQLMDDVGGQGAGHAVDRGHPGADAGLARTSATQSARSARKRSATRQGVAERDRDVNRGGQLQAVQAPAPVPMFSMTW